MSEPAKKWAHLTPKRRAHLERLHASNTGKLYKVHPPGWTMKPGPPGSREGPTPIFPNDDIKRAILKGLREKWKRQHIADEVGVCANTLRKWLKMWDKSK